MSPTTAASNGNGQVSDPLELLVLKRNGTPVNLLLLEEGLVVTRRKTSQSSCYSFTACQPSRRSPN